MFYVPLIRTLRPRSDEALNITTTELKTIPSEAEGAEPEVEVVTKREEVPVEQVLKYIATGNYKWSSFDVDTTDRSKPVVRLEVLFDGHVGYQCVHFIFTHISVCIRRG
jgi:alkaline phosphatase D